MSEKLDSYKECGKNHRFHFVMNHNMVNEIKAIAKELGSSFNKTMRLMLTVTYPLLVKTQLLDHEDNNVPEEVNWDFKTHVTIDKNLYRRIKGFHSQMNTWSMAVVVRWLFRLFMKLYKNKGLFWVKKVVNRFTRLKFLPFINIKNFDKRKILKDLSGFFYHNTKYIIYLNQNYQLLKTEIKKQGYNFRSS